MAGSNAGFDAAAFRTAIRDAMTMGSPTKVADRATFRWTPVKTFDSPDPGANPYTWTQTPTSTTTHADVQIPVAVEFAARPASSSITVIGEFDASRAELTILDDDYALVEGANEVLLGENTYDVKFVAPPVGLFDVTVYTVYLEARDES